MAAKLKSPSKVLEKSVGLPLPISATRLCYRLDLLLIPIKEISIGKCELHYIREIPYIIYNPDCCLITTNRLLAVALVLFDLDLLDKEGSVSFSLTEIESKYPFILERASQILVPESMISKAVFHRGITCIDRLSLLFDVPAEWMISRTFDLKAPNFFNL